MITNINIKNYKSVVDVDLPLGRFNLLIGANGCGKSNILECIALGAAASSDKLEYEYFANRGIRVVEPHFMMLPAFEDIKANSITIAMTDNNKLSSSFNILYNSNVKPARWETDSINSNLFVSYLTSQIQQDTTDKNEFADAIDKLEVFKNSIVDIKKEFQGDFRFKISKQKLDSVMYVNPSVTQFLIYSLEESKLRKADNSNRTYPLGRHGEGLFAYLKEMAQRPEAVDFFNEIKDNLKVLDWFDDMQVPSNQLSSEFNLKLKDNYLSETLNTFDQRSTNEGFLYLLFYFTLVISDETPNFFAIENIDTALNPKLCREVIERLVKLARKHDKQIIATTHNPAILDGINLSDNEQKLMVVQRSIDGYTKVRTIKKEEVVSSDLPLSQLWIQGYIGGLPNNF